MRAPRYTPEAQLVADYIALANRGGERRELNERFAALPEAVRTHISRMVPLNGGCRGEIDRLVEEYRAEERKGPPPSDNELRERAALEFIRANPIAPAIIETLQNTLRPAPSRRGRRG